MKSVKFNKFVATIRVLSSSKCTETRLPGGARAPLESLRRLPDPVVGCGGDIPPH